MNFPKLPEVKATWAPIYLEPIMQSGERITVGIAGVTSTGEVQVMPTLNQEKLRCAFGESGVSILDAATICLDEFSDYLKDFSSLEGWEAPLGGVSLGHARKAAGNSLHEILSMASQLTASFSSLQLASESLTSVEQLGREDRWPKQIKEAVTLVAPDLEVNFNKNYNLVPGGAQTKYDYWGEKYIANFGRIMAPHSSLKDGRAKLWNLARLREAYPFPSNNNKYELLLWRPPENSPAHTEKSMKQVNETILELTEEAKKEELGTFVVLGAQEASQRIILMEAA